MLAFYEKFRAFILAALVHVVIGAALVVGFEHSTPINKPAARAPVEIIKGAAVDEDALKQQLEQLKQQDEAKRQAEIDRQKRLEEAAKKAEQARKAEEEAKLKAQEEKRKAEDAKKRKRDLNFAVKSLCKREM